MFLRLNYLGLLVSSVICIITVFCTSCASKEEYVGTYKAQSVGFPSKAEVSLELKENGEGTWRTGDEEISVIWYVKGEELRLNTKEGGVIVGKIQDGSFKIELPGSKTMSFKKVK